MSEWLLPWQMPPALYLLGAAPLMAILRGTPRKVVQVGVPLLVVWQVLSLSAEAPPVVYKWMGLQLKLLQVDDLRLLFGLIFSIMAVIGNIYALHLEDRRQHPAAWIYAGGALGVTFAGDLIALIVFWESMAVSSVILVFTRQTPSAYRAGIRYLGVHGLGGALFLAGIIAWFVESGSLEVTAIPDTAGLPGYLMLAGVAINAAIPPLGSWLPDAYGDGTVTGSVFLSAYTTKTAVFTLIALFPGWKILLWAGVIMALYGVVYAVLENNIRRLLAYHIISQVGYMVAAAGMGTAIALDGGAAHAFSHILYKSLLFMGAGAVVYATGKEKLTELGGIYKAMPLTLGLYAVGAASISGFPLFNGFISKSIVVTAGGQGGWPAAELALTVASIGTFLHTGLKLLWFTFVSPTDRKHEVIKPLPKNMTVAMIIGASLCTLFGLWPDLLYARLPYGTEYHPYTPHHVLQSVQLLVMTAFCFWYLFDKLHGYPTVSLDTDWVYRKLLPKPVLRVSRTIMDFQQWFGDLLTQLAAFLVRIIHNPTVASERLVGRGIGEDDPTREGEIAVSRYRVPVGISVIAMLTVFAVAVVLHLLSGVPA